MNLFIQTLLGIIALIGGVTLLYFFIVGLNISVNFLFLILSFVLICVGSFLFIRVSKLENSSTEKDTVTAASTTEAKAAKLLEKNNKMIQEWNKTNQTKDSLKMVELAVAAKASDASHE